MKTNLPGSKPNREILYNINNVFYYIKINSNYI